MNNIKGKVAYDGAHAEPKSFTATLDSSFAKYLPGNVSTIKKLKDYVYEVWYSDLNYSYYEEKLKNDIPPIPFGCSSIRNGSLIGRSFDYFYDNKVTFVVHTPHIGGRYETTCHCGQLKDLTQEFVESGKYSDSYISLPFMCMDGYNECGLVVNVNLVPNEKGNNSVIVPSGTVEKTISSVMVLRFILDYFKTADEAITYLKEHCVIFTPKALLDMGYNAHYMLCDGTKTYAVEFINGAVEAIDISDAPYLFNFHRHGVELNPDNTVYTPETMTDEYDAVSTNKIEEHGQGLERHNIVANGYSTTATKAGMRTMLDSLKYSNAYNPDQQSYWHTEFAEGLRKVNSPVEDFLDYEAAAQQAWTERNRSKPKVWHSVHQVIYDTANKKIYSVYQEDGEELEFDI